MHVLIIPPGRYVTKERPLSGIFQYHQARALQRSGVQVGVIAPEPRSLRLLKRGAAGWTRGVEFDNSQGIPTYRYQGWGWVPGRTPHLVAWFRLVIGKSLFNRYVAEQGVPDVIHAHNALYAGVIAARIREEHGVAYAITEHSSRYARGGVRHWQISLVKDALRNAAVRIAVSPSLGTLLEAQFGKVACPWEWIPNILDGTFERTPFPSEKRRNAEGTFRFLNIASLVEIKGHAGLLKAFAHRFGGNNSIQLRVGGDGPLLSELEASARDLGIASQVVFLGMLSREQVRSEMQACDAFVLSSHYETFGVVLIEALAYGKPVVATAGGGPECIVNAENGILVPPRDVTALGNAMEKILRGIDAYNETLIRQDCIARFGEGAIVEKLRSVYDRTLASGREAVGSAS
jgi:glycosyltransferase involved in cell wall biosynthesis